MGTVLAIVVILIIAFGGAMIQTKIQKGVWWEKEGND
jgi:hypothetical protein